MRKENLNVSFIVVILAVVYGIVMYTNTASVVTGAVGDIERNISKWNDESIERDPIGYLRYKEGDLDKNILKLNRAIGNIRRSKNRNVSGIKKQEHNLGITNELLKSAKSLYKSASLENSWPIYFLERDYEKDEFYSQVELFLGKKSLSESAILALKAADSKLQENLVQMYQTRQKVMIEQARIKTTTLLIVAKNATKTATISIVGLKELDNEVMDVSSFPIRDVDDIIKDLALNKSKTKTAKKYLEM